MTGRRYAKSLAVGFGDVDYARILYYPRLLHFCHLAMEGLFREVTGESYEHLLSQRGLGFPTVHIEVDYRKPFPYGSTLNLEVSITRIGTSSLAFRYVDTGEDGSGARAEVHVTTVCVDMESFSSVSIPEDLRTGLEEYLELDSSAP